VRKKQAAPKASVNKSQAIRDYTKAHPKAGPTQVAAELKKEGIDVSAAFVSTVRNLAKKSKRGRRKKAATVAKPAVSESIEISALLSAKKLIEEVGGIEKARAALAALAKLQ
jgi:hypothetical protein